MTPDQWAWAAGLFEGEGHIGITDSTPGPRPGPKWEPYKRASLRLAMTDRDVVQRFHTVVGCGKITRTVPAPPRKPYWTWRVDTKTEVKRVLKEMLPWLGARRTRAASDAIALCVPRDVWATRRERYGHAGHS